MKIKEAKIGDTVEVEKSYCNNKCVGQIVSIDEENEIVGVAFLNWIGGHDCKESLREKNGWYYRTQDLSLTNKPLTNFNFKEEL